MTDTLEAKQQVPINLYKMTNPLLATVIENTKLSLEGSPHDVRHIVLRYPEDSYRYLEGQSAGIVPPGLNDKGKPHILRLYSIASDRLGDDGTGTSLTLTVKRVVYTDEAGVERRGVCSNYLCDSQVGDQLPLTGPTGRTFLLPDDPASNIIMLATGTGIAPFRAFLRRRHLGSSSETGISWLFFGMQTQNDLLYRDELESFGQHPQVRLTYAISREQKNAEGGRMYVQHRVQEHAEALFRLIQDEKTVTYICGLKGMEDPIAEALGVEAAKHGIDWPTYQKELQRAHRWHVETY